MKVVFYQGTLREENLTANDRIVYSQILYRSIMDNGRDTFSHDGKSITLEDYDGEIAVSWSASRNFYDVINISRSQFYLSKQTLRDKGLLFENYGFEYVSFSQDTVSRFFELQTSSGLSGVQLIVYSYLVCKTKKYHWIDKYHASIASELMMSPTNFANCLAKLFKAGLIEKKKVGEQVLLRAVI